MREAEQKAFALIAGLVAFLLGGCAASNVPPGDRPDTEISRHAMSARFIGFEVGDYLYTIFRDGAGKSQSFFVGVDGVSCYLAQRPGELLQIEYAIVDSYIEQAGGVLRIERLVGATDGRLSANEWWQAQLRTHTWEQLQSKCQPLIERYSMNVHANETLGVPTALEGKWRLTGKSHCPHICAMDAEEAGRLKGAVLAYSATAFSNGRDACSSARFVRRGLTAEAFLAEYRFKAETLGLGGLVIEEFSVQCKDMRGGGAALGATVLVKDERTLIVPWDGVFFEARRE